MAAHSHLVYGREMPNPFPALKRAIIAISYRVSSPPPHTTHSLVEDGESRRMLLRPGGRKARQPFDVRRITGVVDGVRERLCPSVDPTVGVQLLGG